MRLPKTEDGDHNNNSFINKNYNLTTRYLLLLSATYRTTELVPSEEEEW